MGHGLPLLQAHHAHVQSGCRARAHTAGAATWPRDVKVMFRCLVLLICEEQLPHQCHLRTAALLLRINFISFVVQPYFSTQAQDATGGGKPQKSPSVVPAVRLFPDVAEQRQGFEICKKNHGWPGKYDGLALPCSNQSPLCLLLRHLCPALSRSAGGHRVAGKQQNLLGGRGCGCTH